MLYATAHFPRGATSFAVPGKRLRSSFRGKSWNSSRQDVPGRHREGEPSPSLFLAEGTSLLHNPAKSLLNPAKSHKTTKQCGSISIPNSAESINSLIKQCGRHQFPYQTVRKQHLHTKQCGSNTSIPNSAEAILLTRVPSASLGYCPGKLPPARTWIGS